MIKKFLVVLLIINITYADDIINYYNQKALLQNKINIFKQNSFLGKKITKSIRYGDYNPEIYTIKQYLSLSGEYKDDLNYNFDDNLLIALKKYQINNNLTPNGELNQKTINSLNYNFKNILSLLSKNYNRILNYNFESNMILVNIPFYNLSIYNNYNLIKNMNVIVGKQNKQTCELTSNINNIVFNPSWYVPTSISKKEMSSKLMEDPNYFIKRGFKVYYNNQEVDINNIQDENIDPNDLKFVQTPSSKNALGKIKFIFPNNCGIYLHDTNQKNLFGRDKQNLSHGCVRVEDPIYLATFLMEQNGYSKDKIIEYYNEKTTKFIQINNYQVNIIYQNIVVNDNNELVLKKDIYNKNKN